MGRTQEEVVVEVRKRVVGGSGVEVEGSGRAVVVEIGVAVEGIGDLVVVESGVEVEGSAKILEGDASLELEIEHWDRGMALVLQSVQKVV